MFALYHDEDRLETALLTATRAAGFQLVSATEARMTGREDEHHLEFAAANGRVLYSANVRDYNRLHRDWMAAGRNHAGIIVCSDYLLPVGEQVRRLLAVAAVRTAEEMVNRIEFLSRFGVQR